MKKMRKALASLAIAGMVLSMAPASVFAADADRIEGKDRYATSVQIAEKAFASATTAIVAAGNPNNLVDSLAAAPLAAQEKAPIYLTNIQDKVDIEADLLASLKKLGVTKVFAVGAAANDAATVAALEKAGITVEKVAGASRIETAEAINAKLTDVKGTIVVGLKGEADAMSVASFAAANGYQIVIADGKGETTVKDVKYIIGGPTLVKDIAGAERIYGADRYATNEEVVKKLSFEFNTVYVANGASLADALAASVLAAQTKSPILLSNGSTVKAASYVNEKLTSSSKVVALGGTGAVSASALNSVKYQAPATISVESVTALNLGQIKVTFNKAVNKTSATEPTNYTLVAKNGGAGSLTGAQFTLSDDKQSVIIDLANATLFTNQKDYTLTVKDVKDVDGTKLGETSKDFSVVDLTLPVVEKVEVVGTKTLKVTMSEPVDTTGNQTSASFKIDNGSVSAPSFAVGTGTQRNVITLTLASELSQGAHTLTINAVKDLAGFYSVSKDISINYVKDTTAPTVSIKEVKADAKTVVIKFSKDIDPTNLLNGNVLFTHTYNSAANQVSGPGSITQKSASEYEVTFVNTLPPGTTNIFIKYVSGASDASKVKDLFGNILQLPVTLQATVVADMTAPTVVSVSQKDADEIYVDFSEDVNATEAQIVGNYVLKNSKNETVSLAKATYSSSDKRTTLQTTANLKAGDYTLEVRNIHDKAVVPNKMVTATFNLTVVDKVAPTVSLAAYNSSNKKLTIKFDKEMAGAALGNLENYALIVDGTTKSFPTGTQIAVKDAKTVEITLGATVTGLDGAGDNIQISGSLADAYGNKLGGISVTKAIVAANTVAPAYVADSAKFIDEETIVIELDTELQGFDTTKIKYDGAQVASASYVNDGNKSVLTVKVAAGMELTNTSTAGWTGKQLVLDPGAVTSTFNGANTVTITVATFKDKAAPFISSVATGDADNDGQIDRLVVTMSEAVVASSVDASDFSLSDSYSINSIVSVNSNVITLKLNEYGLSDTGVTPSISIAGAIEDLAGNATSSSTAVTATDAAKPVYVGVSLDDTKKVVTIAFSEDVLNNKVDLDALKNEVTFAADGAAFAALGASDSVAITNGKLVITFNSALTGDTNKIKINAGALKDAATNAIDAVTTAAIDAN